MAKPRRGRRTLTTVVILVLVSVSIITLAQRGGVGSRVTSGLRSAANDVFDPIQRGVDNLIRPIGNAFAGAVNYPALSKENAELRQTVGALRQQVLEGQSVRQQLRQITALEHLTYLGSLPTVTAETVAIGPSNFADTITIDKGRSDGVAVGMPVVGAGGLVGQVVLAYNHQATVRLLTDGQSKIGVQFGNPANLASATGQGQGDPLAVDFVVPGTPVKKGELLTTNGLADGEYPPGIPVATISSASTPAGAGQISITAEPVADLDQLAYVDVVLWLS